MKERYIKDNIKDRYIKDRYIKDRYIKDTYIKDRYIKWMINTQKILRIKDR